MIGIYVITNIINNKKYVGQSLDIKKRWARHKQDAFNNTRDYPLYRAIKKYGIDNFLFEVVCECSVKELNNLEIYYIEYYDSFYNGYNQTLGGNCNYSISQLECSDAIKYDLIYTSLSYDEMVNKYHVSKQSISAINNGRTYRDDNLHYPLREFNSQSTKINTCVDCGKEISLHAKYCNVCAHRHQQVVDRPSAKQLAEEIVSSGFCAVGRKYGVSDNAIRKWCIAYNLPTKKQELREWLENN